VSHENPCEAVAAARASLAGVRQLLLRPTPENLNQCLPRLSAAIGTLEQLRTATAAPADQIQELARDLARIIALLHHAGRFHLGWATFLAPVASEYGLTGSIFPAPPSTRMAYEG